VSSRNKKRVKLRETRQSENIDATVRTLTAGKRIRDRRRAEIPRTRSLMLDGSVA
jgi:hypothetical protein